MNFRFQNDIPLYLQLEKILEQEIVSGRLAAGDKLPSVRELALMSKTNPNTVSKALTELERKGLIETRRTSGKFVKINSQGLQESRMEKARELCIKFLEEMNALGFSIKEVMTLLQKENKKDAS